jgi:hypothetical protein
VDGLQGELLVSVDPSFSPVGRMSAFAGPPDGGVVKHNGGLRMVEEEAEKADDIFGLGAVSEFEGVSLSPLSRSPSKRGRGVEEGGSSPEAQRVGGVSARKGSNSEEAGFTDGASILVDRSFVNSSGDVGTLKGYDSVGVSEVLRRWVVTVEPEARSVERKDNAGIGVVVRLAGPLGPEGAPSSLFPLLLLPSVIILPFFRISPSFFFISNLRSDISVGTSIWL